MEVAAVSEAPAEVSQSPNRSLQQRQQLTARSIRLRLPVGSTLWVGFQPLRSQPRLRHLQTSSLPHSGRRHPLRPQVCASPRAPPSIQWMAFGVRNGLTRRGRWQRRWPCQASARL